MDKRLYVFLALIFLAFMMPPAVIRYASTGRFLWTEDWDTTLTHAEVATSGFTLLAVGLYSLRWVSLEQGPILVFFGGMIAACGWSPWVFERGTPWWHEAIVHGWIALLFGAAAWYWRLRTQRCQLMIVLGAPYALIAVAFLIIGPALQME